MIDQDVRRLIRSIQAQFGLPDLVPHLYRLLAAGEPVTVERAADAGGWTEDELRTELARHPGADWDDAGRIAGFGLTLRSTPHKFTFDGRTVHAFCASDALAFPVVLGVSGVVESNCPVTGQRIRVEVTPAKAVAVDPPGAVVSKVRPEHTVSDIRAEICALGNFFSGPPAASGWLRQHPEGMVVPIAEDFEVTRLAMIDLDWAA